MAAHHTPCLQQPLGRLELLAKEVVEGFLTGLHKSPFHGFSVEFAEHRPYNTGEDTRHIDWRLYARTDRLFVKKYSEETNMRCHFLLDMSSSMYFPLKEDASGGLNKLRFSLAAAASLGYLLYRQRDAVSVSTFADELMFTSDCKSGATHWHYLLDRLSYWYEQAETPPLPSHRGTHIAEVLHLLAEKLHKRSMVVLLSDMFDETMNGEAAAGSATGAPVGPATAAVGSAAGMAPLTEALQHLRYRQHEVLLFHVQSREKEINLQYENRPHRFVDVETGKEVRLNPYHIQADYLRRQTEWQTQFEHLCQHNKIEYIPAFIEDGLVPVLQACLSKRRVRR